MTQFPLLDLGHCSGPLFAPAAKRKSPRRIGPRDHGRIRRAAEKRAMPPWADRAKIREMSNEVDRRNYAEGWAKWSLGHVVPLQHPLVCGLHWHGNMQIEPMDENNRKNNRTWTDMWEVQPELFEV